MQARRKVSREAGAAFQAGRSYKNGATVVENGNRLYLHGNLIAEKDRDGATLVTLAGWHTVTTRDRLNALDGVSVSRKKGVSYLNGKAWDGSWIKIDQSAAASFSIADHVTECDASRRGGIIKVDVSDLFPEVADWDNGDEAIIGASQNYLGGGMLGSIGSGAMFNKNRLSKKQRAVYDEMADRIKRYFFDITNEEAGDWDEWSAAENYEAQQRRPVSGY